MNQRQWIDLDKIPQDELILFSGRFVLEQHGEMEILSGPGSWLVQCPKCGAAYRFTGSGKERISQGRAFLQDGMLMIGQHSSVTPPGLPLRIEGTTKLG